MHPLHILEIPPAPAESAALEPVHAALYRACLHVREEVLRLPLGRRLSAADTALDHTEYHLAAVPSVPDIPGAPTVHACVSLRPLPSPLADGLDPLPADLPAVPVLKLRQMAVQADWRGTGLGTALVQHAEALARRIGHPALTLHARQEAVPFYARLGYRTHGTAFEEIGIPHVRMYRVLPECPLTALPTEINA